MSAMGQYLPKADVRVRSAFPLITTKSRTSHYVGEGPVPDMPAIKHRAQLRKHPELLLAPILSNGAAWRPSYIAARLQGTMFRDLSLIMRRYLTKGLTRQ
jgi:hypothetical protein